MTDYIYHGLDKDFKPLQCLGNKIQLPDCHIPPFKVCNHCIYVRYNLKCSRDGNCKAGYKSK